MPARSGDCTSVLKRVSRSCGSTVRGAAGAVARRALKVRSSIYLVWLSADAARNVTKTEQRRLQGEQTEKLRTLGGIAVAEVFGLIPLDQLLHPDRVPFPVPVAQDGIGAAAGFDEDVRQQDAGVDVDRRDVRQV